MNEEQIAYCRNLNAEEIARLPFRKQVFRELSNAELAAQASLQQAASRKIPPQWLEKNLFIPDRQALEQCTSALVARWKQSLVPEEAEILVDASAGMGIDALHLAENIPELLLFEDHPGRAAALRRNVPVIRAAKTEITEGMLRDEVLEQLSRRGKNLLLYADPDRRDDAGGRLRGWENFRPDVRRFCQILRNSGSGFLLKLSPLEDPEELAEYLPELRRVFLVSVHNEVKEVLLYLEFSGESQSPVFEAVELRNSGDVRRILIPPFREGQPSPCQPEAGGYLLDPFASLRKGRFAACLAEERGWKCLSAKGRLYFSPGWPEDFPGRVFRIEAVFDSLNSFRNNFSGNSCHVVARDFPADAEDIRKKLRLVEAGTSFLFCYRNPSGERFFLLCTGQGSGWN